MYYRILQTHNHYICIPVGQVALQVVICCHRVARASCSARRAEHAGRQQWSPQKRQGKSVSELHPETGIWADIVQRSLSKSIVVSQVQGQARKPSHRPRSGSRRSETRSSHSCYSAV